MNDPQCDCGLYDTQHTHVNVYRSYSGNSWVMRTYDVWLARKGWFFSPNRPRYYPTKEKAVAAAKRVLAKDRTQAAGWLRFSGLV